MHTWQRLLLGAVLAAALLVGGCRDGSPSGLGPTGGTATKAAAAATKARPLPLEKRAKSDAVVPASLRMALLRSQQTAPGFAFTPSTGGGLLSHIGRRTEVPVRATERGVRLSLPRGVELGVQTVGVGRGGSLPSRRISAARAEGQEWVLTSADGIVERYQAGPLGLEQSLTLPQRLAGSGDLEVAVAFTGLTPLADVGSSSRVSLVDAHGQVRAGYRDLLAIDASGRDLPARMVVHSSQVLLDVDDEGAVYPVVIDPVVWTLQTEAPGTAADGWFGLSVAISGTTAIVGAPLQTANGHAQAGAAYVWVEASGVWTQQAQLIANDAAADDWFGQSVALSGSIAVIGAPYHTASGKTECGAAYVFTQSGTSWAQQQELVASDAATADNAGTSVAVSGYTIIVGAPFHAVGAKSEAGAAYAWTLGTSWTQQATDLVAGDGKPADLFGYSVSVSGATALIGAYQHDVAYPDGGLFPDGGAIVSAGAAYLFTDGTSWTETQELTASDGATADDFGYSVSVSGALALVGAYQHNVGATVSAGAAYVFAQGTPWTQQAELEASAPGTNDFFGYAVSLTGGTALVGAPQHEVGTNVEAGAAYGFTQTGTTWTQQQIITAGDDAADDLFGASVAASGDAIAVGAPQHKEGTDAQAGAAYFESGAFTGGGSCYFNGVVYANGATCPAPSACETSGTCNGGTGLCSNTAVAAGTACDAGDACDQTQQCNGAGACVGSNPVTCAPLSQCYLAGACNPVTGQCTTLFAGAGTACDAGDVCDQTQQCNGAGTCVGSNPVTCTAEDQCHTAGTCNPVTGCSNPDAPSGTACDAGDVCDQTQQCNGAGACVGSNPITCTALDQCHTAGTCNPVSGCSNPDAPSGTACDAGNLCDQTQQCNGAGACVGSNPITCTAEDQCHTAGTCSPTTGICSNPNAASGTHCDAGDFCDQTQQCNGAGACVGSNPITCTAEDQCHTAGTCSPTTGVCSNPAAGAGTSCDAGNVCDQTQQCNGTGACVGSNPITCTAEDQCHTAGTCNAVSGCSNPNAANGTSCDAGNLCDQTQQCSSGVCVGSNPITCTALDQCHVAGTCSASTGVCSNPIASAGTSCNDGDPCTQTDVCDAGSCEGFNPVVCAAPDQCASASCNVQDGGCLSQLLSGISCDGGQACAGPDLCQTGVCTASVNNCACSQTSDCPTPGQCQTSVVCNISSGTCVYTNASDGTACDDGNPCTQTDTCSSGSCVGSNPVVCKALDQCHTQGSCLPGDGGCTNPVATNGVACDAGEACLLDDTCQSGACTVGSDTCACTTASDCAAPTQCQLSVACTAGQCVYTPQSNGTTCNDQNACTSGETCQAGVCGDPTATVTCGALDQCHAAGTCDPATGLCSNPKVNDGTACDAGLPCLLNDTCQAGLCAAGSSTCTCTTDQDCSPLDQCHQAGTCDAGTCTNPLVTNGTPCNDDNACTSGETCQGGVCGDPTSTVTCAASGMCSVVGVCDTATGVCSVAFADAGAPCGDAGGTCNGVGTCEVPDAGASSVNSSSGSTGATSSGGVNVTSASAAATTSSATSGSGGHSSTATGSNTGSTGSNSASAGATSTGTSTSTGSAGASSSGGTSHAASGAVTAAAATGSSSGSGSHASSTASTTSGGSHGSSSSGRATTELGGSTSSGSKSGGAPKSGCTCGSAGAIDLAPWLLFAATQLRRRKRRGGQLSSTGA